AEETGLSIRAVQYARDQLVEQGVLEVIQQGTGHRATDYHLPFRSLRGHTAATLRVLHSGPRDAPHVAQGSTPRTPGMHRPRLL
ncbi:hypothetical protein DD881_13845, partial [Staphylococcus pseudintermedius]